jgi:thymidylate synthase
MPHLIQTDNCLTAWRDACRYIIHNGNGFNLLVFIRNPLNFNDAQLEEIIDTAIINYKSVSDVINTIFPSKLYNRNIGLPRDDFYKLHEKLYYRGKTMHSKNKSRWGNYFLRLTRFGNSKKNQLQNIIDAINSREKQYAACYYMHISSVDTDNNTRVIGNPCLQYIQFGLEGDSINLTAVYRNHDFLTKALGNYIGLSRLLEYVCEQTGKKIGTFACHSIHYFLDNKKAVENSLNSLTW